MTNHVENKLTKKELNKIFFRGFWLQLSWNYEVMQGMGYCATMMPLLEKNYKTKEAQIAAAKSYMEFFNCNPHAAHAIIGANVALEEQYPGNLDVSRSLKLSLMGPLSSIGDTLIVAVYGSIIFALTAAVAQSGLWIAAFMPLVLFTIPVDMLRYVLFIQSYKVGKNLFSVYAEQFERFKKFAYIFGLIVIGGLGASFVKVNIASDVSIKGVPFDFNSLINSIFPGLAILGLILIAYTILGKKWMNSTRLLLLVLVFGFVMGYLGILVK